MLASMTNAAELLLRFFESDSRDEFSFSTVWAAINEIEAAIETWGRLGQDVSAFETALPTWKSAIRLSMNDVFRFHNASGSHMSSGDLGVLKWVARDLGTLTPEIGPEKHELIRNLLQAVRQTIIEDNSLSDDLRMHIARLVLHIEECLDNWQVTGDFFLASELDRLFGALRIAEDVSADGKRWSGVWETFGRPIAVGLIVSIPTLGIAFEQMLAIQP